LGSAQSTAVFFGRSRLLAPFARGRDISVPLCFGTKCNPATAMNMRVATLCLILDTPNKPRNMLLKVAAPA
jgi:hypothetical protein